MTSDVAVNLCIGMRSLPLHQSAEVSIAQHPAHLPSGFLMVAISSAPGKLPPMTDTYQRRCCGERADEVGGEVMRDRGGEEARRWEKGGVKSQDGFCSAA